MKLTLWQELAAVALGVAAITIGCGSSDNIAAVLAPTGSSGLTGLPTATGTTAAASATGTPLATNQAGKAAGQGTPDDVTSADRTADAISAVLAGGPLDAADLEGGSIDDPDINTAAFRARARPRSTAAPASSSLLLPEALDALQLAAPGTASAQPEGTGVRFTTTEGLDVKATGISATVDTTGIGVNAGATGVADIASGPVDGFAIASSVRLLGALAQNATPLDVRFAGVSGIVGRNGDGTNAIDLTVAAPGVTIGGLLQGATMDLTLSGLHGHFTDLLQLNRKLAAQPVQLHVASVVARNVLDGLSGELAVQSLHLPSGSGDFVTFGISGQVMAALSAQHPLARSGRVGRVTVTVDPTTPLTMQGVAGPLGGTAQVALDSPDGRIHDTLTWQYQGGIAVIFGTRTNASGDAERVTSTLDTRTVAGSLLFSDGSRAEHQLSVRHSNLGRRIQFQYVTKDSTGAQVLAGDSTVHADRSITGTWTRPAPHGSSGTYTITPDGELDLIGPGGDTIATTQMRDGWDALLY